MGASPIRGGRGVSREEPRSSTTGRAPIIWSNSPQQQQQQPPQFATGAVPYRENPARVFRRTPGLIPTPGTPPTAPVHPGTPPFVADPLFVAEGQSPAARGRGIPRGRVRSRAGRRP